MSRAISFHYYTKDPYRIYGIHHFIQKYGFPFILGKESTINIVYGYGSIKKSGFNIQILENEMQKDISGYLKRADEKVPIFEEPIKHSKGKKLGIYIDNRGNEYSCITIEDNSIIIGFDIFNEVGHILSGYLENFWKLREEVYRRIMKIPVVDYYEKTLFDCILLASYKLNISLKYKSFWPRGKRFAVCLTHDVDRVHKSYQYIPHFVRYIRRGDFRSAMNQITSVARKLHGDEPYWNFDRIMEIERNLGVKSTFFFLNERKKACIFSPNEWKLYWGRYDIKDKRIVEVIKKLDAEGWEIGVHGSYNSYRNLEMLREEKETLEEILGKSVHGISQHYCNLEIPSTWEYHEKLGFSYDASLGFVTDIGFRWGTCHPFHPFNPENGRILSLWELPIIIMDNACAYKSWQDIMEIINTVERYNGLLLLRWHQSVFNEREFPGRSKIYERIIKVCKERNAWITNAYSIAEWLTMREKYGKFENPNN